MNTSLFVVLCIGAVVFLSCLLLLLWWNRASDQNLALFFRVYAGLIFALVMLLLSILSPLPEDSAQIDVLFVHDENQTLAPLMGTLILSGSAHTKGYIELELVLTEWREAQRVRNTKGGAISNDSDPISGEFYLDIFEKTFWRWLAQKYGIHWMAKHDWFWGISSGSGSMGSAPNAEESMCTLSKQDIVKRLSGNRRVLNGAMLGDVKFPVHSKVALKRDGGRRTIEIDDSYLHLKIELTSFGRGVVEASDLAEKINNKYRPTSSKWWEEHIRVSFYCQYTRWYRWSPETKRRRKWVEEMIDMFRNDFEWSLIRNDLEKAFNIKK